MCSLWIFFLASVEGEGVGGVDVVSLEPVDCALDDDDGEDVDDDDDDDDDESVSRGGWLLTVSVVVPSAAELVPNSPFSFPITTLSTICKINGELTHR